MMYFNKTIRSLIFVEKRMYVILDLKVVFAFLNEIYTLSSFFDV